MFRQKKTVMSCFDQKKTVVSCLVSYSFLPFDGLSIAMCINFIAENQFESRETDNGSAGLKHVNLTQRERHSFETSLS